ncbi:ATP-dependent DNA helicase MER3 [Rhizina undulata]
MIKLSSLNIQQTLFPIEIFRGLFSSIIISMSELLDEIADVLDDADNVGNLRFGDYSGQRSSFNFGSNAPFGRRNSQNFQQQAQWNGMDSFDRQLLNEPPRDDDPWNNEPPTAPRFPPPIASYIGKNSRLSLSSNTGPPAFVSKSQISLQQQKTTRPFKRLEPSQLAYNPRTPKRNRKESSSPPLPSPTPYRQTQPIKDVQAQNNATKSIGVSRVFTERYQLKRFHDGEKQQPEPPTPGAIALSHAPPVVRGITLVSVNELPDRFRSVFPFPLFNAVQSRSFPWVYGSKDNVVLSSPTGSGKTAILELAICALVKELDKGNYKVIYQAPTKALCAERKRDWEKKFSTLGLVCTEMTGDTDHAQLRGVKNGDIIITTPEKWDSMTRRWQDHRKLLELVRLFMIDEVHILKETRGATLEAVVSRMKTIGSDVRFIALSATVPNASDIASWLGRNAHTPDEPAHEERFGEEFRPVQLQKFVYGYQAAMNDFMFDKTLDKNVLEIIRKHSSGKPIMIFCMTRSICVSTSKLLAERWRGSTVKDRYWGGPNISFSFKDKDLQNTATCGVAFHHAGLDTTDRNLVERLFMEGHIQIICCTSTLAVGVNLPTHLVIIKNTATWADGNTKEYVDLEIMQMLGRAGRPQFDDTGVAVIMTKKENKIRYEKMVSGTELLESCLHANLIEHLNAEIGLGTITNVESAKQWLKSTFLYVRLKQNPAHYKLDGQNAYQNLTIDQRLEEICEKDINLLTQEGLISNNDTRLKCSEFGLSMARYYIKFATMQTILALTEKAKLSEILIALSQADEFRELRFRAGEKGLYKELNKLTGIRFPVKVEMASPSHKVFILIQFEIGMLEFPNEPNFQKYKTTLMQDKNAVFQHCPRIIRCIIDCKLYLKDSISVKHALEIARCLKARVWENSPNQLRQVEGFGPVAVKKLVNAGVRSIEELERLEPHKIEMLLSRNPPFGSNILKSVRSIPRFRVFSHQISKSGNRRDPVQLKVSTEIGYLNDVVPSKYRGMTLYANFMAERSDGVLLEFRRLPIFHLEGGKDIKFMAELESADQTVICYMACEDIVGTVKIHELIPEVDTSLYPPPKILPTPPKAPSPQPIPKLQSAVSGKPLSQILSSGKHGVTTASITTASALRRASQLYESEDEYDDPAFMEAVQDLDFTHIDNFNTTIAQETVKNTIANSHAGAGKAPATENADDDDDAWEPTQLPNGNWACRHKCGDKTKCKHFCCRQGLEKPPKSSKKKLAANAIAAPPLEEKNQSAGLIGMLKDETWRLNSNNGIEKPIKIVPRVSQLVSSLRNVDVEVVDLVGAADEDPYYKNPFEKELQNLKKLHSSSSNKLNVNLLQNKPKYSYSSKEKPDLSFIGVGKPMSSEVNMDDELPSPRALLAGGKEKKAANYSPPLTINSSDYDDPELDHIMAEMVDPTIDGMVGNQNVSHVNRKKTEQKLRPPSPKRRSTPLKQKNSITPSPSKKRQPASDLNSTDFWGGPSKARFDFSSSSKTLSENETDFSEPSTPRSTPEPAHKKLRVAEREKESSLFLRRRSKQEICHREPKKTMNLIQNRKGNTPTPLSVGQVPITAPENPNPKPKPKPEFPFCREMGDGIKYRLGPRYQSAINKESVEAPESKDCGQDIFDFLGDCFVFKDDENNHKDAGAVQIWDDGKDEGVEAGLFLI